MTIRLALFDDHPLMREGLAHTLATADDFTIVAQGASATEAVEAAKNLLPDLILLDLNMPGGGIEATRQIAAACPVVKIVILTVSEEQTDVSAALDAGAHGYALKGISGPDLIATVRAVLDGESYVSPDLAARLLMDIRRTKSTEPTEEDLIADLSFREEQILKLVARGLSNKEAGRELDLSEKTVKHYMTNILQKLHVRNRVEAALVVSRVRKLS